MIHVLVYFVAGYLVLLLLLRLVGKASFCHSLPEWQKLLGYCLILSIPLLPYVLVESITISLRAELLEPARSAVVDVGGRLPIRSLKVIRYWRGNASVYVVSKCGVGNGYVGEIMRFRKAGGRWSFTGDYDTVWSDRGSAGGNIFPPYLSSGDYK